MRGDNASFDRNFVPEQVMENDSGFIDLYYKACELAYNHIKTQTALSQSLYMDAAFDESTIWIWGKVLKATLQFTCVYVVGTSGTLALAGIFGMATIRAGKRKFS